MNARNARTEDGKFYTTNVDLAAYIQLVGPKCIGVEQEGQRGMGIFVFMHAPSIDAIVKRWFGSDACEVDAKRFVKQRSLLLGWAKSVIEGSK